METQENYVFMDPLDPHEVDLGQDSIYHLAPVSTLFYQQHHDDILGPMGSVSG